MPPEDTNPAEKMTSPVYSRTKKYGARCLIFLSGNSKPVEVVQPYRTIRGRMNEARTHFEVTIAGPQLRKMLIAIGVVQTVFEV